MATQSMADEIDEVLDVAEDVQEAVGGGEYSLEIFMSTDGKHTVHVSVTDPRARREATSKAMEMYDYIVARYGTKQAQAVREYSNGGDEKKADQENCQHINVRFGQSKTEKNPGRWFKSCKDCGKFLGWQS